MSKQLSCSIGQYSHQGRKQSNQDSHGSTVPAQPYLSTKGISLAIADGISSSEVSQVASQVSVKSFLEDYYCTSETWSVKTAAQRVLLATNSWLFAQNQRTPEFRITRDKGYVCTFTALIIKSNTAYLFHVGDAQVSRLRKTKPEKSTELSKNAEVELDVLTQAHRVHLSDDKSYLSRALGTGPKLEIDYTEIPLFKGDTFLLATDGAYEYLADDLVISLLNSHSNDLELAAKKLVEHAIEQGSDDNVTVQLVRVDELPSGKPSEFLQRLTELPFPPTLHARMTFDGYSIVRELHHSSRSRVLLALDKTTNEKVAIKLPSTQGSLDEDYLERFLMEEWIANRVNSAHVLKPHRPARAREYCYVVNEYVEGQTLAQWMTDNPAPSLEQVRNLVEQIAVGLQAFHRQEMLHQDIRPNNIMIDSSGAAKIIDFGSTLVSGVDEAQVAIMPQTMPGTAQFLAPEYFIGEFGTKQSDLYSLACVTYHMLCGRSPYGVAVARASTRADQNRLVYQSVLDGKSGLPIWIDLALKKGLQTDPRKRYTELSEFIQDLRKPNAKFLSESRPPLIERNPLQFWQGVSAILGVLSVYLLLR